MIMTIIKLRAETGSKSRAHLQALILATILLFTASYTAAQPSSPWFGVTPPPGFNAHETPVILGADYGPRPAIVPAGEESFTALTGEAIYSDLEAIVEVSKWSHATNELGDGQLWGRITGLPSGERAMDLVEQLLRDAGIEQVERQWFEQTTGSSLWLPLRWEVRLHGNEVFGAGSQDIVLESAMPAGGSVIPPEGLTAPVVYVGTARPSELARVDVAGKIAVQHITPRGHLFLERGPARAKAQELMRRGAVAVFNVVDFAGNMRMRDISNCNGPCFNIGGQDGRFLETILDELALSGSGNELTATLSLEAEQRSGMRASNVLGIVPGESDENIIINAHVDGWFDGANDNGDGLAIMIALAEHFARPENKSERTLVFVGSAGHHTSGLNGPDQLVALNPQLIANNVLTINLEHVAAKQINPARTDTLGVRDVISDAGEGFLMNGISKPTPYLESVIRDGGSRYGLNFVSAASTYHAGDNPDVDSPIFQLIQGNPLYHTSGETLETISIPGLERVARFVAYLIKEITEAERSLVYIE